MGRVEIFEDLEAWRKARELVKETYKVTSKREFSRDYSLCNQIRRASVSVMSNISEGFERGGDKEFYQFLSQAKGSCGEVRSQLYTALDLKYIDQDEFSRLSQSSYRTSQVISGLMRYLKASGLKGSKFK